MLCNCRLKVCYTLRLLQAWKCRGCVLVPVMAVQDLKPIANKEIMHIMVWGSDAACWVLTHLKHRTTYLWVDWEACVVPEHILMTPQPEWRDRVFHSPVLTSSLNTLHQLVKPTLYRFSHYTNSLYFHYTYFFPSLSHMHVCASLSLSSWLEHHLNFGSCSLSPAYRHSLIGPQQTDQPGSLGSRMPGVIPIRQQKKKTSVLFTHCGNRLIRWSYTGTNQKKYIHHVYTRLDISGLNTFTRLRQ